MNHSVSKTANGTTLNVSTGDTITITLPYDDRQGRQTAWSFGDNFNYNTCLSLDIVACENGVRTMTFQARKVGVIQIAMHQFFVLGIAENTVTDRFELTVNVL